MKKILTFLKIIPLFALIICGSVPFAVVNPFVGIPPFTPPLAFAARAV
jgi:hypothetical protein